jgi:hypothetical protein
MRKRRIRIRTMRRKSARGSRAPQALRFKAAASHPLTECRTYVTETHYEL